ncbi:MAG: hypothetical protein JO340_11185 [Acidobacteriaceae bacterium]|nr:hypothetical protein [Acidobacteriaceae bacterium]
MHKLAFTLTPAALALLFAGAAVSAANDCAPILPQLPHSALVVANTVPANGDVNPYGVAFVPHDFASGGAIHPGDILVSNFNNSQNLQGTGSTIVSIAADGHPSLFFQGHKGLGLSTALAVLKSGVVLVGNVPTKDGSFETIQQGSLIAVNRWGKTIATFSDSTFLDGPWDLAAVDYGSRAIVFVSSVLNGTVSRLDFDISENGDAIYLDQATLIARGYSHRGDPAALVVGPTGLALDVEQDLLYVASTEDNAIYAVRHALHREDPEDRGALVFRDDARLRGPLGLILAHNGDLITSNGDAINGNPNQPSELVEFTRAGHFVAQYSVDLGGQGGAFGLALHGREDDRRLAAVDDVVNTLKIWTLPN